MVKLFPRNKYQRKAQRFRRMVAEPTALLHLVPKLREKKPERKRKNLIRLGIDQDHAYAYSRTRMGGWAVAQSPILVTTITISRLKKRGYIAMLELHLSFNPSRYEPPYTRPVRTVV